MCRFRILSPEMVVLDVVKLGFIMGDYRLFNETSNGDHWVLDFSQATLNHALQFNPLIITKIYYHITVRYIYNSSHNNYKWSVNVAVLKTLYKVHKRTTIVNGNIMKHLTPKIRSLTLWLYHNDFNLDT